MWVIVITGRDVVDCIGPFDSYREATEAMLSLPTYGKDTDHDVIKLHK